MPKTCLVTGGAGFIGSHLVDSLISSNNEVIILDNLSSTHDKKNVNPKAIFIQDDILNKNILENIFQNYNINTIFHLAACPSVQRSINEPETTYKINVEGTHNVLLKAKEYNVNKFIFASSSAVYGEQPTLPQVETMIPNPMSPYGLHKLICEQMCTLYYKLYGIKTISLRYFNVFGPRQNPNGDYACLIPKTIEALKSHNSFTIFGDGNQTRDLVYVKDVVKANMSAAFSLREDIYGQVINVGTGVRYSVNEIVNLIKIYLGSNGTILHGPKVVEPQDTQANINELLKYVGVPNFEFEENLGKTIEWFVGK